MVEYLHHGWNPVLQGRKKQTKIRLKSYEKISDHTHLQHGSSLLNFGDSVGHRNQNDNRFNRCENKNNRRILVIHLFSPQQQQKMYIRI